MSSLSTGGSSGYRRRKITDKVMTVLAYACGLAAIVPLLAILIYVVIKGLGAWNLTFFTGLPQLYGSGGGVAPAIVGTLIIVGMASLMGVPAGIMAGIYLAEYGDNRLGDFIRFVADTMTGIPSIVVGVFAYGLIVLNFGYSAAAGAFALAILMIPIVTRSAEEIIRLVPDDIREASLALGIPRWKTILRVVLPTAISGVLTGIFLAVARVAGETAPLIFTILGNTFWNTSPFSGATAALPLTLYNQATSPYESVQQVGWGAALLLMVLVLGLNLGARLIFRGGPGAIK